MNSQETIGAVVVAVDADEAVTLQLKDGRVVEVCGHPEGGLAFDTCGSSDVKRDPRDIALDVFARIGWFDIGKTRSGEHYVCVDDTVAMTEDEHAALVAVMEPRFEDLRAAWEAEHRDDPKPPKVSRYGSQELVNWARQQREERIASWPQPVDRRHR